MPKPCSASCVALAMLVWLCAATVAGAAGGSFWRGLGDPTFTPIDQGSDQTTSLLPRVMAEDSRGFLWLGGEAGLQRWDGYRFRNYVADRATPDGLSSHYVQALHLDRAGRLWLGTSAGELAWYDTQRDRFVDQALAPGGGGARAIWGITDDGDDGLWVATDAGLFHLDASHIVTEHLRHRPDQPGSLPDDQLQSVLRDRQGVLWVGGRSGLSRAMDARRVFVSIAIPVPGGGVAEVSHLLQDSAGQLWIGTRQQGAFVLPPGGVVARPLRFADEPAGRGPLEIMAITEVSPGTVWFGTLGGIVEVQGLRATRRIRHDPLVPGSLQTDVIYGLYRDRSGLVWVGSTLGLSQYRPSAGIITLLGEPGRRSGLSMSDVTAVLTRPDGSVWLGSESDGIAIIDRNGHSTRTVPISRVFNLAPTADGGVLVGTLSGLFRVDPTGREVAPVPVPGRRADAGVFALYVEADRVWVGGGGDGVWELRIGADGAASVLAHLDTPRLPSAKVNVIARAPDGRIAVGTQNGFSLLDTRTGAIETIASDPRDPHSLLQGEVVSLLVDRRRRLWVGTDNAGLNLQTGRDRAGRPQFRHFGLAEGLPNTDINKMLLDRSGRIWLSTDHGLAVIDPDTLAVRALRAVDGVAIPIYWIGSGDATSEGELIFGGTGGMTVVRPDDVGHWSYRPPVVLTELRDGRQTGDALAQDGSLTVRPEANSLAVEFSALDFSSPASNRYRYRLEGYDRDWIPTDADHRVAAYTNLAPGTYTLLMQGSNRGGLWSAPASLRIIVLAAWFQSLWFRLLEAAAGCLLVAAVAQARTLIMRRRQHELEQQVTSRTAELTASQRELRELAYVDSLTGLANRRAFNETIQSLLQAQHPDAFALLLIDLDGFKAVNDTLGHDAGDAVLLLAADCLREVARSGDFIARLGGDEFAVLLAGTRDGAAAAGIGERAIAAISTIVVPGDKPLRIGASVGAVLCPRDGAAQAELFKRADTALYQAKHSGRGVCRVYATPGASREGALHTTPMDLARAGGPWHNAVEVHSDHPGDMLHRLDVATQDPGAPWLEHGGGDIDLLAIKDVAQMLAVEPGARGAFGGSPGDQGVEASGAAP